MSMKQESKAVTDAASETPAARVCRLFGGATALARALGKHPSSVQRWGSYDSRGLQGRVPSKEQGRILALARERGIPLTAEELIAVGPYTQT